MPLATGAGGKLLEGGAPVIVTWRYGVTPADQVNFVAPRAMRVTKIMGRVLVGASGATAVLKKAPSATAIASGTALHSGSLDLNGTVSANQTLTLSATTADLDLAAGDCIGMDVSGTTTNADGCITIEMVATG